MACLFQNPKTRTLALVAIVSLISASAGAAPFDNLYLIDGVSTSRNGQWIVIGAHTVEYHAKVPGYKEVVSAKMGTNHQLAHLTVECRTAPTSERARESPPAGEFAFPDHPDQRPYNWWDPRYWIYELTGKAVENLDVSVTLKIGEDASLWRTYPAVLMRYRTDYSFVRLLLSVPLDGESVLAAFARAQPIHVEVSGADAAITASFPASPQLVPAVRAMTEHCPRASDARATN